MKIRQTAGLFALLMTTCLTAAADTKFKIITNKGFVAFAAEDNWGVLKMQPKLPVAMVAFQLPNPADAKTDHSTNLALKLYDRKSEIAKAAYNAPLTVPGGTNRQEQKWAGWTLVRHDAQDRGVTYTIIDAKRPDIGDVASTVRLAWPRLKGNAPTYDAQVETRLRNFLKSIKASKGPYKPEKGEVVRRLK